MKKLIILLMLMSISSSCFAMNLPTDKVAHFGVGYIVNDQLKKNTKMTFLERLEMPLWQGQEVSQKTFFLNYPSLRGVIK